MASRLGILPKWVVAEVAYLSLKIARISRLRVAHCLDVEQLGYLLLAADRLLLMREK